MKTSSYIAVASLLVALLSSHLMAAELVVAVDNLTEAKGSLYVSLYKNSVDFNANENAVKRQKLKVDKSTITINLGDVPVGEYAVKAYQDVNDNGTFDFSSAGMPSEPFGSSSKSKGMAPPDFNEAKFSLEKNQQVQVYLLK